MKSAGVLPIKQYDDAKKAEITEAMTAADRRCRMEQAYTLPLSLKGEHWTITAVCLNAFTDDIDTPVHKSIYHLFRGKLAERVEGNVFFLENEHDGNAFVLLSDCPDYERAVLTIRDFTADLTEHTSTYSIHPCKKGECEAVCRRALREGMDSKTVVAMSNTWGDRNGFSRICEEFVLKEIDRAAEIGLDIVQIDDGWQFGSTADRSRRDQNDRRFFDDDFWELNRERFPRGMEYIADYAAGKGVTLGLWFAPDSREHFARLERDVSILKNAYDHWGIRFFKLDMYWIESLADKERFLRFLKAIYSFGKDVAVQLDVTRNARVNYLCGKQYGTVFVENRYTKTHTFFPHRTLKNLWLLSHYIPASRLQFELVNPDLNRESYAPDDEFATPRYDIEYLFASVMLSNPLFWMELQFLSEENTRRLQGLLDLWKKHRVIFSRGDVQPIGECPSGRSFTGFHIRYHDEEYALLFREVTQKQSAAFLLESDAKTAEIIVSNTDLSVTLSDGVLKADFSSPRSYAFLRLS